MKVVCMVVLALLIGVMGAQAQVTSINGTVEKLGVRLPVQAKDSDGYCGPYFILIPAGKVSQYDVFRFRLNGVMHNKPFGLGVTISRDRAIIIVDDTVKVPLVAVIVGEQTKIRISSSDLEEAKCLTHESKPSTRA